MTTVSSTFSLSQSVQEQIERKFKEKRLLARAREHELFDIFRQELTEEETWALKYLYAFMPVSDMADYDGALFLSHVRKTLDIRQQVPWGDRVPDHLFLHYVLPYRVNTENIEDHRGILYNELAERTVKLTMKDAILETNYWCHEKATYIGTDMRTISPLTMLRSARGRCGEESTFTVAALRSIGIPARQVYTPRWAHCDDNHAWVEAWADGQWYYIGACEPEARLNQGWFGPPARRAMLINTRISATVPELEDMTPADGELTEINLLEGYAPTRTIKVRVKDGQGQPVVSAEVQFQLYNMAEFYPIATLPTDALGEASFKTGFGDLLVRAVKAGQWGEVKVDAHSSELIDMVIDQTVQPEGMFDLDMVPPPEREGDPAEALSDDQVKRHQQRVEEGASIRKRFEDTFMSEAEAARLADSLQLPSGRVWEVISKSRGNCREIASFLSERTSEYGQWPLRLLESLNEKDLIDTMRSTLDDHLIGSLSVKGELGDEEFSSYVLCPRVQYEMIVPYRSFFQQAFTSAEADAFRADPRLIAADIDEGWEVREDLPNLKGKGNPVGTFSLKAGDRISLNVLFVAICRSLGIPARLHPSEQKPQYAAGGLWIDAPFTKGIVGREEGKEWGKLLLLRDSGAAPDAPAASYSENFSFARLENGVYKTLAFPEGKKDVYDQPFEVEPGAYRLISGVRLKDGTVRVRFAYVNVQAGETTDIPLMFRYAAQELPILGSVNKDSVLTLPEGGSVKLEEITENNGALFAWLETEREPSKHLLRELGELAEPYNELGIPVILIAGDTIEAAAPLRQAANKLPQGTRFASDPSLSVLTEFMPDFQSNDAGFPHVFVLDGQGQIRYTQSGYKLGTGKEALQALTGIIQSKGAE